MAAWFERFQRSASEDCKQGSKLLVMVILAQVMAGLVIGYLIVTVCESFFHRTIQHASQDLRRRYGTAGWFGQQILYAWYSHHVVHHFLTFRQDHVTQFSTAEEKNNLDAILERKNQHDIMACKYGVILGDEAINYLKYVTPTALILAPVCYLGGAWFTAGALIPFVIWPLLAQFIHPYLHRPYDEVLSGAPPIVRWIARTSYFRRLARHHWLHHRYTHCNYNLLLGGDHVLGVHRRATIEDVQRMQKIGLWVEGGRRDRAPLTSRSTET